MRISPIIKNKTTSVPSNNQSLRNHNHLFKLKLL